ncbi:hypothetical protein RvY_17980 [Ramazzottius varieornatus]|uniref:Cation/H+ exchanger domain-containing protein n=1 Tax=Ramazzottius varieornatus TaxID=947166 RepID=A0A1D1W447_RAMVA|nr:hypothetical protein RvY_17980 [Ramazzottius varieornatus]
MIAMEAASGLWQISSAVLVNIFLQLYLVSCLPFIDISVPSQAIHYPNDNHKLVGSVLPKELSRSRSKRSSYDINGDGEHPPTEHEREDDSVLRHCFKTHNLSTHHTAPGHELHLERCTAHAYDENSPHIHSPAIFFITITLVTGSLALIVIHVVHHYVMIPYTVVVLLLGCVYGLIVRTNCAKLSWFTLITDINAEVFLLIFLPVLIYESAFTMQIYLFHKLLLHMLIVGSIGMGKKSVSQPLAFVHLRHCDQLFMFGLCGFGVSFGGHLQCFRPLLEHLRWLNILGDH